MQGWAKLHRKIIDNPIFKKPELFQLFNYCVLMANHIDKKIIMNGNETTVERGSFITGRKVIAKDTGQGESAIYKRLKVLENLKMISVKSNNRFSVLKVLNYCIYQGSDIEEEQPSNNQVTTREQPSNTTKNDKELKELKETIPYGEIIDYLNLKTSSKYKKSSEKTKEHIRARWNDKFTLIDFKTVIDKKVASWTGTDQEKYLRPETLFGNKFEGYVNEKTSAKQPDKPERKEVAW